MGVGLVYPGCPAHGATPVVGLLYIQHKGHIWVGLLYKGHPAQGATLGVGLLYPGRLNYFFT